MKFNQAFEKIKKEIVIDTSKLTQPFAVQINMVNKDCGGAFYVEFKSGNLSIEPYDYNDRDAMLTLMMGDIAKLAEKKLDPGKAVENGKISYEGSAELLMMLYGALSKKPSEPKKAAPKRTPKTAPEKSAEPKTADTEKNKKEEKAISKPAAAVKKETAAPKKAEPKLKETAAAKPAEKAVAKNTKKSK